MSSIPINTLDNTTTSPKNANEKGLQELGGFIGLVILV